MQLGLNRPSKGTIFVVFTLIVLLTPVLMEITGSGYAKLIEDAAYLIMIIYSIILLFKREYPTIRVRLTIVALVFSFMLFVLIGIYYNGIFMIILQFRELKYLLLLIILLPYSNTEIFKGVWPTLKIIAAVNIPVSIIQWFLYSKTKIDSVTGIMGFRACGILTFFALTVFFSELGIRLKEHKNVLGFYLLYLVPTALNETKITIILFPIMLFFTLVITKRLNFNVFISVFIIVALLFFGWSYMYKATNEYSVSDVFSLEYLENYMFSTEWIGDAGRMAKVLYALDIIGDDNLLFGYGLGASYRGSTSGVDGYISNLFYTPEMFGGTRPQIFVSFIEIGVLGTIIITVILLVFFKKVLRIKKFSIEKLISTNLFIIVFASLLYQQIFYFYQIMYLLLFYTIVCLRYNAIDVENRDELGNLLIDCD